MIQRAFSGRKPGTSRRTCATTREVGRLERPTNDGGEEVIRRTGSTPAENTLYEYHFQRRRMYALPARFLRPQAKPSVHEVLKNVNSPRNCPVSPCVQFSPQ
jgi:hypothetical protein